MNRQEKRKMIKQVFGETIGCGTRELRREAARDYITRQDARAFSILTKKPGFLPKDEK